MESTRVWECVNQLKAWPKSPGEMDQVAQSILSLLEASFVVFISNRPSEESGMSFSGPVPSGGINREKIAEVLKKKIREEKKSLNRTVPLQFTVGELHLPLSITLQHLAYFPVLESGIQIKRDVAYIAVGSRDPLDPEQEAALGILAQHLSSQAKITDLDSAVQIRNQFLSIASHELKTPLTSIYGILQLQERMLRLKKEGASFPDQERHHNFLKMVIRQVERLNELIDGLLDVSRIQNGRFMVEPSETDVAETLRDCVQSRLNVIAQEATVKLTVDSVERLIAQVDPVRIEEVISNLVMNAIRFSPEGGVVWIKLRGEESGFRLTVRDQGPSIPIEDRERIFHPFERAQRTSRMGGLGLGLFISRQIAQLHGGNVSLVESVPGKGNVFEAYFPGRPAQVLSA